MNTSEIEDLLEKYYAGETSLQEEKSLKEYFLNSEVPDTLKSHKQMFSLFNRESRQEISNPGFDQKISGLLGESLVNTPVIKIHHHKSRFLFITSIAASILILIGLFFTLSEDFLKKDTIYISESHDMAYAEANEALLIVSSNLNAGLKQVERLQMVDKAMKNLQLFNKFYQCQSIIINPDELQTMSKKSK